MIPSGIFDKSFWQFIKHFLTVNLNLPKAYMGLQEELSDTCYRTEFSDLR